LSININKEHQVELVIKRKDIHGNPSEALLTHREESIEWNVALFEKMNYKEDYCITDIFEQINQYWAYLPLPAQNQIFDIYKRIKLVFDTVWEPTALTKQLIMLVKELYDYHDLAAIKHWVDYYGNLKMPLHLDDVFDQSKETQRSRDRTYLKEDYRWLVVLSIALRPMVPIWGLFIKLTGKEAGTRFKEYNAYRLLSRTKIDKSEPMEFLRKYVARSIPEEKSKDSAILGGLSSEDFPTWALALVLVRRLSIGDVRGANPLFNLVADIHRYIVTKVMNHDMSFAGQIKDKFFEGVGQEGEVNLSKLEGYKMKQEVADGDIEAIRHYAENIPRLALRINPGIDMRLVEQSLKSVNALSTKQITKSQIIIAQWVMKAAIPPQGILLLPKPLLLKVMAVAQAVLWHKGHYELAGLLTAIEQSNKDEMQDQGTPSRAHIPKEMSETLDKLFPFSRKQTGRKPDKKPNVAVEAIGSVVDLLNAHNWKLTLPDEWVIKLTGNKNDRTFTVPYKIKEMLAALSIEIANRSIAK
jgi:hypothetical protein